MAVSNAQEETAKSRSEQARLAATLMSAAEELGSVAQAREAQAALNETRHKLWLATCAEAAKAQVFGSDDAFGVEC